MEKFDYEHFKNEYQNIEEELKMDGIITGDKPFKGKPKAKTVTVAETI